MRWACSTFRSTKRHPRRYKELLAFYQDNPLHRWWEPLQQGGGLIDYCLQTSDLAPKTETGISLMSVGGSVSRTQRWEKTSLAITASSW